MLCIKLKIRNIEPFFIVGNYRPPSGNLTKYVERLNDILEYLTKSELFIIGDIYEHSL